jgi:hypothetical protein
MCELRGFSILKAELEPIEEEPDDCLSQYSRNGACRSQKNGTESNNPVNNTNRQQQESGQNSQTNTITRWCGILDDNSIFPSISQILCRAFFSAMPPNIRPALTPTMALATRQDHIWTLAGTLQ